MPVNTIEHCPRCQQISAPATAAPDAPWVSIVCNACRAIERQAQGEAMRLFSPAPNQIPGQLAL